MFNNNLFQSCVQKLGLSNEALAAQIGVSSAMIIALCKGLRQPSLALLCRIAKVTGVPAAEFIIEF